MTLWDFDIDISWMWPHKHIVQSVRVREVSYEIWRCCIPFYKQPLIKTAAQADKISELSEWKAENALLIASAEQTRLALDAAQEEKKIREGFIQDAKNELAALTEEKAQELAEARQRADDKGSPRDFKGLWSAIRGTSEWKGNRAAGKRSLKTAKMVSDDI